MVSTGYDVAIALFGLLCQWARCTTDDVSPGQATPGMGFVRASGEEVLRFATSDAGVTGSVRQTLDRLTTFLAVPLHSFETAFLLWRSVIGCPLSRGSSAHYLSGTRKQSRTLP
jgi:hypothetical protein